MANRCPGKRWAAGSGQLKAQCYSFAALVRPRYSDRQPCRHWCRVEFAVTSSATGVRTHGLASQRHYTPRTEGRLPAGVDGAEAARAWSLVRSWSVNVIDQPVELAPRSPGPTDARIGLFKTGRPRDAERQH